MNRRARESLSFFLAHCPQRLPRGCQKRKAPDLSAGQGLEQCRFSLFPLDGFGSVFRSFQLHPVFGSVSSRVPPGNAMTRFVGFGDKSWDNFKNFFQTQGFEFLFLSQRARRAAFVGSIAPKTPVSKLNRPSACKPPAAIANDWSRAASNAIPKPQVRRLRC